jgi:glycine cleavage system H protein
VTVKFSQDHEWVFIENDIGTVGITDFAQEQLGDIVFVEMPEIESELVKGDEAGVVESVKAASEIYAPISGVVVSTNAQLDADPSLINSSPEKSGWIFKIRISDPSEIDGLLDEVKYQALIKN